MKRFSFFPTTLCLIGCLTLCAACSDDDDDAEAPAELRITVEGGSTSVATFRAIRLTADASGATTGGLRWTLGDSLLTTSDTLEFIAVEAGRYPLTVATTRPDGSPLTASVTLSAAHPTTPYAEGVATVLDYTPAPGQFVNQLPAYAEGDTPESMNAKALQAIQSGSIVTLGSYGGYIVCGFDHTVPNLPGNDLRIEGNCYEGGSEPGVVAVAFDRNRNGRPDADEWYELAGSAHDAGTITANYAVTYRRPAADHVATPSADDSYITDDTYIAWIDNRGATGYVCRNQFHTGDYFPAWIAANALTFDGTLLPPNATNQGTASAPLWVLDAFAYGYADNLPNARSLFDIDNATDAQGRRVSLPGIDFVRIHTGVLQYCGWIGETSTEVGRIVDLHLNR